MKIKSFICNKTNMVRIKWIFRKRKSGYTLVELMIAIVIGFFVIGMIAWVGFLVCVGGHFLHKWW
jgi:Tfp pilus assembly protein PilV